MRKLLHPLAPLLLATALGACSSSAPRQSTGPMTLENQLHVADVAGQSGDATLAMNMLRQAASAAPDNPDIQRRFARTLAEAGDLRSARMVLDAALARRDTAELRYDAGRLAIMEAQYGVALQHLDAALARNPRYVSALTARGVALDLAGKPEEAQASFRAALALQPNTSAALNNLGLSLLLQGKQEEARAVLEQASSTPGASQRIANNLGLAYAAGGQLPQAESLIGTQLNPDQVEEIGRRLASPRSAGLPAALGESGNLSPVSAGSSVKLR